MSATEVTYAKAGGPPDDWRGLAIIDLDTGQEVLDVTEVDTVAGWLVSYKRNAEGSYYLDGDQIARQRIEGRYQIRARR